MDENYYDVVIIGAGASGLFCAGVAGKRGLRVLVVEHNRVSGRKILISGGGRCNFTNLYTTNDDFVSGNIHFAKSSLSQYLAQDFLDLVIAHQIKWVEKAKGQLFCQSKAIQIIELLHKECEQGNVEFQYNCKTENIELKDQIFNIKSTNQKFKTNNLVIATGGLSLKEIGASDFGHRIAKQFGHKITELSPALVPLIFNEDLSTMSQLSGISIPVRIMINKKTVEDDLLITKKGMSGPAILKASLYYQENDLLQIDFLPQLDLDFAMSQNSGKTLLQILKENLPNRLIDVFATLFKLNLKTKLGEVSKKEKQYYVNFLKEFQFKPLKTEGYRKAEVTRGGVSCKELNSKTMESKLVKGLYFIGEVVDVTGQLGGYNFQWAWSSAQVCGNSLATQVK
ncbi:MAG: NAD(P)/FAD-dependent oxidoreductase [Bacteriovoracaceae bacterium]|jgi:predicted Rossmann fold flavoprotein|nr:NAD(P)/FAD-dependent oxidoreductase [Bacteriovoracaceae bacterium]